MTAPSLHASDHSDEVTPVELFFDLVFVFAVAQLSHHLREHLSWRGGAETLVLLLAVYAVWFSTSWQAIVIGPNEPQTHRMLLTVMVVGLFMNAAVTGAFAASGWAFVLPLLVVQLGRTFWTLLHTPHAVFHDHYVRTLVWLVATAPLWIVGAAVDPHARLLWWMLAAGIDLVGRGLAHPVPGRRLHSERLPFAGGHMLERCRLFLLIALGETVLATGTAIAVAPMTVLTTVSGTVALIGTVDLWALAFRRAGRLTLQYVEATTDPVFASRHAGDVLTVMVAGLIVVAVANSEVIADPQRSTTPALNVLLCGGPLLFLLAQGWYFWGVLHIWPHLRAIGSTILVVLGLATLPLSRDVALLLTSASLTIMAVLDRP